MTSGYCPNCGAVTTRGQSVCIRCNTPLAIAESPFGSGAAMGETCRMYRAATTGAMLLLSKSTLEYDAADIALVTSWTNVSSVRRDGKRSWLWLFKTPDKVHVRFGTSSDWYSDLTRSIPLDQFGFPANADLRADLRRYAPHLRQHVTGSTLL